MRPDASRDSIGARVAGITTPNSAAARAGLQVGDVITRFNGTALGVSESRSGGDDEEEQSRPAMRLINLASRLSAGDTVRLDLRRGSSNVNATLVAGESDMDVMVEHMRMPGMEFGQLTFPRGDGPMPDRPFVQGWEGPKMFVFGGPIVDLELVKVNPGLGEYFGTQDGLLVVSVGGDSALGLRNGDVILTIGGRRPASPPQAMRILGTYEPDEAVQFDVMRQRRRVSVSGKIPRRQEQGWSVRRDNFEFDEPMEMQMEHNLELMLPKIRHPGHAMIKIRGEV
jgi:membrane-associated protease RseP (regulator of RpoE activity)